MTGETPRLENKDVGSVVCRRDFDESNRGTTSVLLALDSLPGFDAQASDAVLSAHVDPDALDALFQVAPGADRMQGFVTFPVGHYVIGVSARGDVVVRDPSN